ncbi:terpene synthase family protein [Amycolatopsis lurida]
MEIHAAEEADRHILSWADSIRIFRGQRAELERFKLGTFAALTHSGFASSDHLLFATKNIAALMSIDDHYCDEEVEGALPELAVVRLAGLLPFLEEPQSISPGRFGGSDHEAEDPVALAVRDVMHHAALLGSPAQVGRLRREYVAMCLAMAGESAYRVAQRTPTLGEYVAQRPFNGAMACLAAIDIAGGFELGACEYDRPAVRGLTLLASSLILLVNDLYSGHKESVTHGRTTIFRACFASIRS